MPFASPPPIRGQRNQRGLPGTRVLAVLVLTCMAMLGAIYWVVRSAQP